MSEVMTHRESDELLAFRIDQERRSLSPETIRVRMIVLGAFERDSGELLEATRRQIQEYLDSLTLSARSRSKYVSHLHNFYAFAIREGLTERDPTTSIQRPKGRQLLPRPVDDDVLDFVLSVAPPDLAAMLCLAAYQGLRCMEVAGQRAEDVLLDHNPPLLVVTVTKGGRPRVVPLAEGTEDALKAYGLRKRGLIFVDRNGRPIKPVNLSMRVSYYLRSIGVDATMHRFRHWFGSECYRRSHDIRMTQELMGHSSIATTQGYVAWSPHEAVGVVRSLGR